MIPFCIVKAEAVEFMLAKQCSICYEVNYSIFFSESLCGQRTG